MNNSLKCCFINCCALPTLLVGYAGIGAVLGAASGEVGYNILKAAGWKSVELGYHKILQANLIGGAITGLLYIVCSPEVMKAMHTLYTSMPDNREQPANRRSLLWASSNPTSETNNDNNQLELNKFNPANIHSLFSIAASGALNGIIGATILHLLDSREKIEFTAAASATGSAVIAVNLRVVQFLLFLASENCYLLSQRSLPSNTNYRASDLENNLAEPALSPRVTNFTPLASNESVQIIAPGNSRSNSRITSARTPSI